MKNKRTLHYKFSIISIILLVLGLISLSHSIITGINETLAPFVFFASASIVTFLSSYLINNKHKTWVRTLYKYSWFVYLLLVLVVALMLNLNSIFLIISTSLILLILVVPAIAKLFLNNDAIAIKSLVILLLLVILSIISKRYRLPFSHVFFTLSVCWFAIGMYMFGIRCLYIIKGNKYLRKLSFFVCLLVTFTFLGLLFKLMHWPIAGLLLLISTVLMLGVTLIVLFTIPNSNYIDWSVFHKKILKKLLYPWIFIFFLFLFKFLVPEVWDVLWTPEKTFKNKPPAFGMIDYEIEHKNRAEKLTSKEQ